MNIKWIPSPCKDCPERHIACHGSCEKYADYKKRHYAEKDRMHLEDVLNKQINELNWGSSQKHEKNKGALKHGYKPKRR